MKDDEFDFGDSKRRDDKKKPRIPQSNISFNHGASVVFFKMELGHTFTPDDITKESGLPGDGTENTGGAVGAWISGMEKAGFIKWTGAKVKSERPERHGAMNKVWCKVKG